MARPVLSSYTLELYGGAFVDIVGKQWHASYWRRKKILLHFNNAFVWELRREGFGSGSISSNCAGLVLL
eukprot:scaffold38926_cov233-Skeletonema_dohrnii-CCMP3373.AAC.4